MRKVLVGLAVAIVSLPCVASATSIVDYSEDVILEALARVTLSSAHCAKTSTPAFNAMDIVWDVVELKAGVDPNNPVVSNRYFSIMDEQGVEAKTDAKGFCSRIIEDFGPQGRVIADLVRIPG